MQFSNVTDLTLLFQSGGEYVFVNPETGRMLTVTLSATAINVFRQRDLGPDDLARRAAEWAVFTRQSTGHINLTTDKDLAPFLARYGELPRDNAMEGF
ncbi:MAG: hypothetical protein AB7G68_20615 [Nitrospiraceae bacterium]